MEFGPVILRGEKISLHVMTKDSLKNIWRHVMEDPKIREYVIRQDLVYYPEDLEKFYEVLLNSKDKMAFLIVENQKRETIGMVFIRDIDNINRKCEIAYYIAKEHRNKGYCTEAVKLTLNYIFGVLNLEKAYAFVREDNKASIRVLEKNGFKVSGKLRKDWFFNGKYYDVLIFEILREDLSP